MMRKEGAMKNKSEAAGLAAQKCKPCEGGTVPLSREKAAAYLSEVKEWSLAEGGKAIRASYLMKNFVAAVGLINRVADLAEADDHHPDVHLTGYRNLEIVLSTHAIGGLSENDFILAAKISALPKELKK